MSYFSLAQQQVTASDGSSDITKTKRNRTIDSLLNKLNTAGEDTNKVKILNNLFRILMYSYPDSAMDYAKQGLSLAEKISDKKGISFHLTNIGNIHWIQSNYSDALKYYFNSIKIHEELGNKEGIAISYNNIGNINIHQGNYSQALKYHLKSLKIIEELGEKNGMARSYNNLGVIYMLQGSYSKSLEYFFKALKTLEEMGDKRGMATAYINIGGIHEKQDNFSQALEYFFNSLSLYKKVEDKQGMARVNNNIGIIFKKQSNYSQALEYYFKSLKVKKELGDKRGIGYSLSNIGEIHKVQGNYEKAVEYYLQSLKIIEEFGDKLLNASNLNNIGETYLLRNEYKKAIAYFNKSLTITEEIGAKDLIKGSYEKLSETYASLNNYRRAFEYYQLYAAIKDTLFNEESSKQIVEMQTKYETEKKEKEIELLTKEKQLQALDLKRQEAEVKKQKILRNSFIGGLIFVLLLAILLYNRYQIKRKANTILAKKNRQITDSIDYAQRIQNAVLPPLELVNTYFPDSFVLLKPKDIVSGDFFWIHQQNGKIMFAAADCTGHGVPGAFMSIIGNNILNQIATTNISTEPAAILNQLGKQLISRLKQKGKEGEVADGMDIALCCLETRQTTLPAGQAGQSGQTDITLQYAGAHNPLYIVSNGELKEVKGDRLFIGITGVTSDSNFTNHTMQLKKGDCIYIFSDGYADQKGGPDGKMFYYPPFRQLLVDIHQKSMKEQKEILNNTMEDWKGDREQIDDMLVIGIRV